MTQVGRESTSSTKNVQIKLLGDGRTDFSSFTRLCFVLLVLYVYSPVFVHVACCVLFPNPHQNNYNNHGSLEKKFASYVFVIVMFVIVEVCYCYVCYCRSLTRN